MHDSQRLDWTPWALQQAALRMGIELQVETRGSVGARNLRIDIARRETRSRLSQVYEILEEEAPEQPDAMLSGAERDARVRAAMTHLSPDQYRVVELAFIEGFSHQHVADRLAIPLGTVKSRLRLALSHLRGRLEDLR